MLILLILVQAGVRAPSEQTWEYKIVGFKDTSLTADLSTEGDQGWEMVSARRALVGEGQTSEGAYECIFKRRKSLLSNLGIRDIPVANPCPFYQLRRPSAPKLPRDSTPVTHFRLSKSTPVTRCAPFF